MNASRRVDERIAHVTVVTYDADGTIALASRKYTHCAYCSLAFFAGFSRTMSTEVDSWKSYHLQCTGAAKETADAHSVPKDITLFGSCFCPFVQRAWVALQYLGIQYMVSNDGSVKIWLGATLTVRPSVLYVTIATVGNYLCPSE